MTSTDLQILDGPALRDLGVPEPWSFGRIDHVRFGELDALGHVNHTSYLGWFEALRVHWFAARGLSSYSPGDPRIVLRQINAEYLAEVRFGAPYIVTCRARELRTTSFTKDYAVFSGGRLVTTGRAVIVLLTPDGSAKLPLTAAQRETLITQEGAVPAAI